MLAHHHAFSKPHKDFPTPSELQSLAELKQWVDPPLQLFMEKKKHQRKSCWQQFQGGKFYIPSHSSGKKKTFSSCNFITRGFIGCPLVRPASDTLPNLGVEVDCAGVKMLCLPSLSWSIAFKCAAFSSRAIVIRHWTHVGPGKRKCEGEISWEFISICHDGD